MNAAHAASSSSAAPRTPPARTSEGDLAGEEEDREAEEDAGARPVEAALEHGERRHGEAGDPADGELTEEEEEAVAEARHGAQV